MTPTTRTAKVQKRRILSVSGAFDIGLKKHECHGLFTRISQLQHRTLYPLDLSSTFYSLIHSTPYGDSRAYLARFFFVVTWSRQLQRLVVLVELARPMRYPRDGGKRSNCHEPPDHLGPQKKKAGTPGLQSAGRAHGGRRFRSHRLFWELRAIDSAWDLSAGYYHMV
jgi:hypothetical protein